MVQFEINPFMSSRFVWIAITVVSSTVISGYLLTKVFEYLSTKRSNKRIERKSSPINIKQETKMEDSKATPKTTQLSVLRVVLIGQQAFGADVYKK
jgi:hypothetical protein